MASKKNAPAKKSAAKKAPAKKGATPKAKAPAKGDASEAPYDWRAEMSRSRERVTRELAAEDTARKVQYEADKAANAPLSPREQEIATKRADIIQARRDAKKPKAPKSLTVTEDTARNQQEADELVAQTGTKVAPKAEKPDLSAALGQLSDQARQRKRDIAAQGVKGTGRNVRKRRVTSDETRSRTPVSTPMTLADTRSRFMYMLYDYDKGGFQPTPTDDVRSSTMLRATGDPENPVAAIRGIPANTFRTVTPAREEEKLRDAVRQTEELAQTSETLAKFPEVDRPEEDEQGRVRNPAMGLAMKISQAGQSAGEPYGVKQEIRIKNARREAKSTLDFLRSAEKRGAFSSGVTLEQRRRLRAARLANPIGTPEDVVSSQTEDLSKEINARTGSQQLSDFAEKLRTKVIPGVPDNPKFPGMPTKYDPEKSGINLEGGLQVSDIASPQQAAEAMRTATNPRFRDRSRIITGPSPVLDTAATGLPSKGGKEMANILNDVLRNADPSIRERLTQNYVDWTNVGAGGGVGAPGMTMPKPTAATPRPQPQRGALIPAAIPPRPRNVGTSKLEPAAKKQVEAVDASGVGAVAESRAMGQIRRKLNIPKRYGRGIGQDTLIRSQNRAIDKKIATELMGGEIYGETREATSVDMSGSVPNEVPIRAATEPRENLGWYGKLGQGKKTSLTPGEMAALPENLASQFDPVTGQQWVKSQGRVWRPPSR